MDDPAKTATTGDELLVLSRWGRNCTAANQRKSRTCQICGENCSTVGLQKLAYTFEVCDCNAATFTHLVEQLWHRRCLWARGPAAGSVGAGEDGTVTP